MIWDDRLAEVWAAPGNAGAGVVVGAAAVLTARHVVAGALDQRNVLARIVRPGASTADWVRMDVLAEDADWDVALLGVSEEKAATGASRSLWLKPSSPSPVFVRLETSAEHDCEAVGFPQSEVQRAPDGSLAAIVRQSEQATGTLLPGGQAKPPVDPERPLPQRWVPFDVEGSTPGTQAGWGGMSGAGVVLADGRLVGLVAAAEANHQQRRLYVVPFADVLTQSDRIAGALSAVLDGPVVIEVRDAQLYRDVLQDGCLGSDGFPVLVHEVSYKAFGVKLAGVPGESAFLDYVPRDADQALRDGLHTAQAKRRMLLAVGGSAGGKSRSAAEAARSFLPSHRLLCPRQTSLGRVHELPIADLAPTLVWLDDAERYEERAFRDSVERLLRWGVVVVATIRRTELQARMPKDNLRDPLGDALSDKELVVQMAWPVQWNDQELARVGEHVKYPPLLAWVDAGKSPSAWVVAGPSLEDRLRDAEADDERPARYALVRIVLDWFRTGIAKPILIATATRLLQACMTYEMQSAEVDDALQWGFESVIGAARITSQSLLTKAPDTDAIIVHDYIQDADLRTGGRVVADAVWMAALDEATSDGARLAVGLAATRQRNTTIASKVWLPLAANGDTDAMNYLGVLFSSSDPGQAREWLQRAADNGHLIAMGNLGALLEESDSEQSRYWYERAAEAGSTRAMNNLGWLLKDSDPGQARDWWQQGAEAGHPDAMFGLGTLLEDSDPGQARRWYERAAEAGHPEAIDHLQVLLEGHPEQPREWLKHAAEAGDPGAMTSLGVLLHDSDPGQACDWWQRAAEAGDASAMANLGLLLTDSDPGQARTWYERAAEAGHHGAMTFLGLLLKDSDPGQARDWWQRAAEAGDMDAIANLGALLHNSDPEQARKWYERAAEAGHHGAMNNLGVLIGASNPGQARKWLQRAAEANNADAMFNLALMLEDSDPGQARAWFKQAAESGHRGAMNSLGMLLEDSDPGQARQWYERAAEAGNPNAMFNLGGLLYESDPEQARQWYERAAEAGHRDAMFSLGLLLKASDPEQARQWYERAAEAGHRDAMNNLGVLLRASDPGQARQWYERGAEAGDATAMFNLGRLLHNSDPEQARQWYERAADTGNTDAMNILGVLFKDSDLEQSRQWYQRAAGAGNGNAMFNLAVLFTDSDPEQARHWYQRAADTGNTDAMTILGVLFKDSDPEQSRQWYQRAAEAGNSDAMFNLAVLYKDSDPEQSRQWYQRAAEAGDTDAMFNLGALVEDSDPEQARTWWAQAAAAGHVGARDALERM